MKFFVSDFCEDDAAIQAYCKEDEQKDAEKIPPKAWFVFFPYSIDKVKQAKSSERDRLLPRGNGAGSAFARTRQKNLCGILPADRVSMLAGAAFV